MGSPIAPGLPGWAPSKKSAAVAPIGAPVECFTFSGIFNGAAQTINPAVALAAGTTAILFVVSGVPVTSVTDSKGNTWTVDRTYAVNSGLSVISSKIATAVGTGDTVTINYSSSQNFNRRIWIQTVANLAAAAFDQGADNNGFSNTASAGPTSTLSKANEIVFAFSANNSAGGGWVKGAGYSDVTTPSLAGIAGLEYKIVSSTAAVSASASWTTTHWDMTIVTYKGL